MDFLSYFNSTDTSLEEKNDKLKNITMKYPFFTDAKILLLDNIWLEKDKKEEIKELLASTIFAHPNRVFLKKYLTRERNKFSPPKNTHLNLSKNTAKSWKQPSKKSNDFFIEEFMSNMLKAKKSFDKYHEQIKNEKVKRKSTQSEKILSVKKSLPKKTAPSKKTTDSKTTKPFKKKTENKRTKLSPKGSEKKKIDKILTTFLKLDEERVSNIQPKEVEMKLIANSKIEKSIVVRPDIVSENLANLYIEQKLFTDAIEVLKKLIWKKPLKREEFIKQIKALERQIELLDL